MRRISWRSALQAGWQTARARLRPATGPIGLDLASERLNLVQFVARPEGPVLLAVASLPYPMARSELLGQPRLLKAFVRDALRRHGFQGRRVVSCLSAGELRFFPVTFSVPPGQDEGGALVAELRSRLGAELDGSVVDYLPIRGDDAAPTERDALVVVAPREQVLAHLALLEHIGLQVEALDVGPAAVARLVARLHQADPQRGHPNTLVINFGQQRCHLSVIWGRRLMLDRQIDFTQDALLARVVRALNVDEATALRLLQDKGVQADRHAPGPDAEMARVLAEILRPEIAALVAEVNKTLIYTASRSRGRSVDQVLLMGSFARIPGADRLMQGCLSIPVAVLDPFRSFRSAMPRDRLAALKPIAGMALAGGLGLRDFAPAREIDLIPAVHGQERSLKRWLGGAALAAVLLMAATAALRVALGLGLEHERPLAARLRQDSIAAKAQRTELAALTQQRQAVEARLASLQSLQRPGAGSGWQQALHSVDAAFGPGLWFNQLTLTRASTAVPVGAPAAPGAAASASASASASARSAGAAQLLEIRAQAVDHARLAAFTRQLGEQPGLRAVRLVDTGVRRYPASEVIDFTVSAQVDALPGSLP